MEEGEGVSWVTYTLTTAGPVTIEAILPGAPGMRSFKSVCAPNVMSLAHSALASPPGASVAGETCGLTILQRDRCSSHPSCGLFSIVQLCLQTGSASVSC